MTIARTLARLAAATSLVACAGRSAVVSNGRDAAATYSAEGPRRAAEWPAWGGDAGALKWSPLIDLTPANVAQLSVAWTWRAGEKAIAKSDSTIPARPGNFQTTPIMIGDTLYFSTPYNNVVALDASTGRQLWRYDPKPYALGQPSNGTGLVHRGVATWSDGKERRVFINSRWRLIALDSRTGVPIPSFGDGGQVDLTAHLIWPVDKRHYTNTSPPVVYENLVIVGNGVGDRLVYKRDPPGDVQAFDVRTGQRAWVFRPIPQSGEYGNDTWGDSAWSKLGHTNVWAPFSVDVKRGLVFLPVSTPSNDWYGGDRTGNNLFAESLVALDAKTGRRVWHYQVVHHGLWDYDLPTAPILATIRVGSAPRDVVVQLTKQGYTFVLDRETGASIFPIDEHPVPPSDVPGERSSPTQPVPRTPAPFAVQGFTENDVIDFTPELKRLALEEVRRYRLGPIYTPPSMQGSLGMPGSIGGAGWGGGAIDPERGILYVKATNSPQLMRIKKIDTWSDTVQATYTNDLSARLGVHMPAMGNAARMPDLPVNKPPYGTLTAIDLARGAQLWQIPLGDSPDIRSHPMLRGVTLPARLGVAGSPGPMVTRGGVIFVTGGGNALWAIDAATGRELWSHDFGKQAYANPMTYRARDGRQYVVVATGAGEDAELVAFAIK